MLLVLIGDYIDIAIVTKTGNNNMRDRDRDVFEGFNSDICDRKIMATMVMTIIMG